MGKGPNTPDESSYLKKLLLKRIQILRWLPKYTREDAVSDFIAGTTVGLTMIPQSLAYAGLAGVPPQFGLYTAFIGSFTYIFFGSIKEVSIGPTSLLSLLTFSYTSDLPIECVILLTFIAGCVELLMGVLHLGFLVDFISPCLTSGFTSASVVIIIVAQIKNLLGIPLRSHNTLEILKELPYKITEAKMYDCILGGCCIVFLVIFKQFPKIQTGNPKVKKILWLLSISKNALIVFITSVLAFVLTQYGGAPFKLTGPVPRGLPDIGFPSLTTQLGNYTMEYKEMVSSLGSGVIVLPVIAILANVAIAKAYSSNTVVDASQEMMTLGLCNIFGSFVKALPSCGAFTRSSIASSSDVRTPLQGLYSGTVIVLALSLFAHYFYFIPKATLAAVLITAVCSLFDYEIFAVLWRCNKLDFVFTLITFVIGTIQGVETAIVIGAILNLITLLKIWSRPKVEVEVKMTDGKKYLYIKPELGLLYPGADCISETLKKEFNRNGQLPIVLDCLHVVKLDYCGAKVLENFLKTYNEEPSQLVLINLHPEILKCLKLVTDTPLLKQLCTSSGELQDVVFGSSRVPEEIPLLNDNVLGNRRKSSAKSNKSLPNGERKLSVYDLE